MQISAVEYTVIKTKDLLLFPKLEATGYSKWYNLWLMVKVGGYTHWHVLYRLVDDPVCVCVCVCVGGGGKGSCAVCLDIMTPLTNWRVYYSRNHNINIACEIVTRDSESNE